VRLNYGLRPFEEPDDYLRGSAVGRSTDDQPVRRQQQVAATLLDASKRLDAMGRRRLQIDMADVAVRVLEERSYVYWPRR
jgi:hypothetical protein